MNILAKALDEIKFSIPMEILRAAFQDDLHNWRQAPVSIDQRIHEKVIKPRVLIDANIVGGQEVIISLGQILPKYNDTHTIIYEVPPTLTGYREIVSVLSVGYLPFTSVGAMGALSGPMITPGCGNDLMSAGARVGMAMSSIPMVTNATADLIGYNTVLIRDQYRSSPLYQLRCMLSNEANLSNINPRSYHKFAQLCVLAVKAYIYNTLIIKIDQAYLAGGQELGALKSYVENLSDSNENYLTFLREQWQKTAMMNDQVSHTRFIRSQISPGL